MGSAALARGPGPPLKRAADSEPESGQPLALPAAPGLARGERRVTGPSDHSKGQRQWRRRATGPGAPVEPAGAGAKAAAALGAHNLRADAPGGGPGRFRLRLPLASIVSDFYAVTCVAANLQLGVS